MLILNRQRMACRAVPLVTQYSPIFILIHIQHFSQNLLILGENIYMYKKKENNIITSLNIINIHFYLSHKKYIYHYR